VVADTVVILRPVRAQSVVELDVELSPNGATPGARETGLVGEYVTL
jgi:hypothetical protein